MMARTHCLFGLGCTAIAAQAGVVESGAIPLGLGVLGALLPDVDCPTSTVGRRVLPLSLLLAGIWGHRTLTHSLVGVGLLMVVLAVCWGGAAAPILVPVMIGYSSHLFLDWLTPSGILLLWPQKRRFRCAAISVQTGSFSEAAFSLAMVLALTLAWMTFYD